MYGSSAFQALNCTSLIVNGQVVNGGADNGAVRYEAQSGITLAMQTAARTNIAAVSSTDSRLTDARNPLPASVSDACVAANAAIAQSKIANLTTDLASKLPVSGGAVTGDLSVQGLTVQKTQN